MPDGDLDDAWQAALAAEQRAAFAYPLLGTRLTGADQGRAAADSAVHDATRDAQQAAIADAGLTPVGTAADYPDLYPIDDATAARVLAARIEDDCAAAWRFLYARAAGTTGERATSLRATAQRQLTASAVRAARWRYAIDPTRATTPFPGV